MAGNKGFFIGFTMNQSLWPTPAGVKPTSSICANYFLTQIWLESEKKLESFKKTKEMIVNKSNPETTSKTKKRHKKEKKSKTEFADKTKKIYKKEKKSKTESPNEAKKRRQKVKKSNPEFTDEEKRIRKKEKQRRRNERKRLRNQEKLKAIDAAERVCEVAPKRNVQVPPRMPSESVFEAFEDGSCNYCGESPHECTCLKIDLTYHCET